MNKPSSEGESSCKRQENGDESSGSDRPLKKARFAWQVKGKYHLKNEMSDSGNTSTAITTESEKVCPPSDSDSDSNDLVGNTEQNLEILGDYLLKQDFNTLDSVITDTPDKPVLKNSPYPNYTEMLSIPKYEYISDSNPTVQTRNSTVPDNVSLSWLLQHQRPSLSEDQCIARWQARQMAKGFVDNTINRVLDSWMVTPIPAETDNNRFLALDVAEFINNLPSGNSIENEGILMAISAHGLQNTSNSSTSSIEDDIQMCTTSNNMKSNVFPSPPSSPASDDENMIELSQIKVGGDQDIATTPNESENKCFRSEKSKSQYSSDEIYDQNHASLSNYPGTDQSSSENEDMKSIYCDETTITNHDELFTNHFDFMDAAVTFAIQNKGLTSYDNEYG